jgi:dephospho-CoA kinase
MTIIAITGLCRSGKDEIANYLAQNHRFKLCKVASALKQAIKVIFNMTDDQVEGHLKEVVDDRWGISPRQALQFIGTDIMQYKIQELLPHIGRSFWIRQLCESISYDPSMRIAISDIRFFHEVEELKKQFPNQVVVLKVIRNIALSRYKIDHPSEIEWQYIKEDILVENNDTISDLHSKVKDALASYLIE